MRLIIQRVFSASLKAGTEILASIGKGLVVLVSPNKGDTKADAEWMAQKALKVRIWRNPKSDKRWDTDAIQNKFEVLVVPQTIYLTEDSPEDIPVEDEKEAEALFKMFVDRARRLYLKDKIKAAPYGKQVSVDLIGDGPVTLVLRSLQSEGNGQEETKKK